MIKRVISYFIIFVIFAGGVPADPGFAYTSQDLKGKIIILDPGHGAESPNVWRDYYEHITMLDLAYKIKPLLEARGAEVRLTRATENDVPLPVRCAMINIWALEVLRDEGRGNAVELDRLIRVMQRVVNDHETYESIYFNTPYDLTHQREIHPDLRRIFEYQSDMLITERFLVISLHSNATPRPVNTSRNGVDIYYMSNNIRSNRSYYTEYSNVRQNYYFGNLLIDEISSLGFRKQRVQPFHFFMLREHNLPAVLVENGFHTNDADRARLQSDAFLSRLAAAYADTILLYFSTFDTIVDPRIFDDVFG